MRIERNPNVAPPSVEDILSSKAAVKPMQACVLWNAQLSSNILGQTYGLLCANTDGAAFLTQGKKFTRFTSLGGGLGDGVADIANKIVPFGGAAAALLMGGASKLKNRSKQAEEIMACPETFFIPYTDVVEARHEGAGGLIIRREFVVLTLEDQNHQVRVCAFVSATSKYEDVFDGNTAAMFMRLRFNYEKHFLLGKIYSQYFDIEQARLEITKKYIEKYGDKAVKHLDEIVAETTAALEAALARNGVTEAMVKAQLREQLAHFRPLVNQKHYEKSITPFFTS